jgi:hypothetical protein
MTDTTTDRPVTVDELSRFWDHAPEPAALLDIPIATLPTLLRLATSPFAGAAFPVLGFLEAVYEQVASHSHTPENKT